MFCAVGSQVAPWLAPGSLLAQTAKTKAKGEWTDVTPHLYQLGIWGGLLVLLLVIAFLVVRKLRDNATGNQPRSGDMLSNFQEMKQEGDISDAEFRNIKAVLGNQLRSDVKSGKKTV
ncbi:MAG TPA: hypothetical protein VMP01_18175 [Pirellulaceae bacterium]|nr:hypothetical protein [Pirellulaceae bacterium]